MFPDGPFDRSGQMEIEEPGSNVMDLTSNDKFVHSDFFNNFEDLFDEDQLDWFESSFILPLIGLKSLNWIKLVESDQLNQTLIVIYNYRN